MSKKNPRYNIFQGNKQLNQIVADSLGYSVSDNEILHGWFTKDIFLSTFFYLSNRFGKPNQFDEAKEAGAWHFKVKNYTISIHLNSSWVTFIMYGDAKYFTKYPTSPYHTRYRREAKKKMRKIVRTYKDKKTKAESKIIEKLWNIFAAENLDESWNNEKWSADYEMRQKWFLSIDAYNDSIIGIGTWREWNEKYGEHREDSHTRHAKRTLSQFLKNMLTPIYIRDVPYNIKGKLKDREAQEYTARYVKNIKIDVDKKG